MVAVLWLCIHECEANLLLYIAHTDQYDRLCSGCLCTNYKQDMLYLAHTDLYDGGVVAAYKEMLCYGQPVRYIMCIRFGQFNDV